MPPPPQAREFAFLPLSIHMETLGGLATPLVLRGTPLPADRADVFTTTDENQSSVSVRVLMGESRLASKNVAVGSLTLSEIPPRARGRQEIRIRFRVDRTCAITVTATLVGSQQVREHTFSPPADMSDEAIARIIGEAEATKALDDPTVNRVEAINRGRGLITTAEERLKNASDAELSRAVADLGLAMQNDGAGTIRLKSDALDSLLKRFSSFDLDVFSGLFGSSAGAAQPRSRKAAAPAVSVRGPGRATSDQAGVAAKASHIVLGRLFGGGQFTLDPQLCFVLMPFADRYAPLYEDHIRPTVISAGLRCQRADEVASTGNITWDIWERINRARLLVADLTDRNANVFYELGLAHALSKDVILLTQSMDFVPFDLRSIRCIEYEFTPRGSRLLEESLKQRIDAVIRGQ